VINVVNVGNTSLRMKMQYNAKFVIFGPGDRMRNDTRVCLRFFSQLQTGISDDDMIKVIRLGKYDPNASDPRPLLVKFADRGSKI